MVNIRKWEFHEDVDRCIRRALTLLISPRAQLITTFLGAFPIIQLIFPLLCLSLTKRAASSGIWVWKGISMCHSPYGCTKKPTMSIQYEMILKL
jgi:hypothetical protein